MILGRGVQRCRSTIILHRTFSTSTYKDKKILIHGNDVAGVSLALFLKKKGISSELVETKPMNLSSMTTVMDKGVFVPFNSSSILKKYGVFDSIHRKGIDINSSIVVSGEGDPFGSVNFDSCHGSDKDTCIRLPFAMSESSLIDLLTKEAFSIPQPGEGTVRLRKQRIRSVDQSPHTGKANVSFSDTGLKFVYDLVVGSDAYEYHHSQSSSSNIIPMAHPSTICQYVTDRVTQTKYPYSLYHFSTIISRPSCFPPITYQQYAKEKKMLSFPLPNDRLAVSGNFIRPANQAQDPESGKNRIYKTLCDFEDLGAHTIVSFLDTAPDLLKLERSELSHLDSFVHGNICLIGESADKLNHGSIESYSIGIEDANSLAEILSQSNANEIEKSLQTFNQERQTRVKKVKDMIDEQEKFTYGGGWKMNIFGKYYLKYFFSKKQQAERFSKL